ncbi:Sphingosine1phosphate lyase 1 [Caligus rogercresseyi]|uniref:Sphingosine1phosphate lyase 1 n=1 Tax=Caligus rogercresseyi TaxID=217165 RepID=A0A7T8H3L9_CALRO|nr:Sphingosine1phosphate lyase 1 [Caligus rogercresseyi]
MAMPQREHPSFSTLSGNIDPSNGSLLLTGLEVYMPRLASVIIREKMIKEPLNFKGY